MSIEGNNFYSDDASHLAQIIDQINAGIWEYNVNTKEVKWSAGFYAVLGYKPGEIECSYSSFLDDLLYHHDKPAFLKAIQSRTPDQTNTVEIRLLTKANGYQWFESVTKKWEDNGIPKYTGSLININKAKLLGLRSAQNDFLFNETGTIAKISGFDIDVPTMSLSLSKEAFDIYELNDQLKLSLEEAVSFFEPQYRPVVNEAIENAIKFCKPYDLEVLFRSAKNNVFWVRAKGLPIIDDYGKCVKIRGILQDIDSIKKKGIALQTSISSLNDQNKRLQNFAYIVSHNLRSHSGNLRFMVNLHEESESADDRAEVFAHIKSISDSLSQTIEHLNEIVMIHTDIDKERKALSFEEVFKNVMSALQNNIDATDAKIEYDFTQCPVIEYIPAYLESIFQNLLTNALKYRHMERQPLITCRTIKDHNHIYMLFEDNGIGIDMERYGDKVFGMYKTFHQNTDAKGIGLFITRNQIESMGGTIKVDSTVNVGTKFTIRLV
ncbi:PAS domain-containing sensor histidine kinase [Mucilaginibacter sp. BJC16-A38]|uniref:PAS domain-containing sensor histidine kinase n=1 Tax=Mucilaginibacter phenanthrenivorans TaxID=1234842 RepID=UPI00215834D7|nr:PAS domain-containing sensor histidine kinase [Mucilaginibacter phenanthrenivorans]MCR8558040.1 PAS domain-containing sensor histidine kinase [Mucilaginibacter phenanthrenivorans]